MVQRRLVDALGAPPQSEVHEAMIFSERATSRNGPLALMTFSTARRRSLEPSTLNGNGRQTSSGSAHSVMTRTSLRSLRIGDSTRARPFSSTAKVSSV